MYFVIYLAKDTRMVGTQESEKEKWKKREERHPKAPEHETVKYFEWPCRRASASLLPVRKEGKK